MMEVLTMTKQMKLHEKKAYRSCFDGNSVGKLCRNRENKKRLLGKMFEQQWESNDQRNDITIIMSNKMKT